MSDDESELIAAQEDAYNRVELRRYPDHWQMVRLRHRVDGGWYVKEIIECAADDLAARPRSASGPECTSPTKPDRR